MLRVFSTFSGVGGLDRPFHDDKRFRVVAHCEIDKFASSVLSHHFPLTPNLGDITKLTRVPDFDVLIGGFPCTDISFQGKQKGFEGKESSLFKILIPIIRTKMPKYILLENVEALLSSKFSMEFNYVIRSLNEAGYGTCYDVFDSSDYGVAQQRKRVLIFGIRKDVGEPSGHSLHALIKENEIENKERRVKKPSNMVSWSRSTRTAHIDHRIRTDGLANTCTTGKGCNGFSTGNFIIEGKNIRIPTPDECEQLMGWPVGWTKLGVMDGKNIAISDSQRFQMIGNGVVSNIIHPVRELIWRIDGKS